MATLTTAARKALPTQDFAGPDRSYPIADASHARDALSRVSANGSPALKAAVRAKVAKKFPSIDRPRKARGLATQLSTMRAAGQFQKAS